MERKSLMPTLVNGIVKTQSGYGVKNFMFPEKEPIEIGNLSFSSYEAGVHYLSNLLYPESYRPYLLAVKDLHPNDDTWNNLIFVGHAQGYYDHEEHMFKSARQLNMNAANPMELAYVEALGETHKSIMEMVDKTEAK